MKLAEADTDMSKKSRGQQHIDYTDYRSKILNKILANKIQKNIKDMKSHGHGMFSFRNSKIL